MAWRWVLGAMLCLPWTVGVAQGTGPRTLVVCAPGHPGTAEQAEPTLRAFARALAAAGAWSGDTARTAFCESSEEGVRQVRAPAAAAALVSLPFYLAHAEELGLRAVAVPVTAVGARAPWVLVAGQGRVRRPADLAGWTVSSRAGYAPDVVEALITRAWGRLPAGVRVTFTPRSLSALRRSAAGDSVAVLLDGEEAAALKALPFANRLEEVFRSDPLPLSVLAVVDRDRSGDRDANWARDVVEPLLRLHQTGEGAAVLREMRIDRFERLGAGDRALLEGWAKSSPTPRPR